MKQSIFIGVLVALILMVAGGGTLYYMNDVMSYVSTDEAKVQGDLSTVTATTNGSITEWDVKDGQQVSKGDVMGIIQPVGVSGPTVQVLAPSDGTIIQSKGSIGEFVGAGTPLAMTTPLNKLYVIANVEESDLEDVKTGAEVKVSIDAYPGTDFTGKVEEIGFATTSTFSMLPAASSSGNYTKVVQKVPVKISLDSGDKLVPGLNATVKISK